MSTATAPQLADAAYALTAARAAPPPDALVNALVIRSLGKLRGGQLLDAPRLARASWAAAGGGVEESAAGASSKGPGKWLQEAAAALLEADAVAGLGAADCCLVLSTAQLWRGQGPPRELLLRVRGRADSGVCLVAAVLRHAALPTDSAPSNLRLLQTRTTALYATPWPAQRGTASRPAVP